MKTREHTPCSFKQFSTGGFTKEVAQYAHTRPDMYTSDYDGINAIFHAYGGNYRIPIFAG